MNRFITLNGMPREISLVLAASSHGRFELGYLKNGMNFYKRFITPLRTDEATTLLTRVFNCSPPNDLANEVLTTCNNVPRELFTFSEMAIATTSTTPTNTLTTITKETLNMFVKRRKAHFRSEAINYYERLAEANRQYLLNTLSSMFRDGSLSSKAGIGDVTGFIDLGLCYRDKEERLYPLCVAATQALLEMYCTELPKQAKYKLMKEQLKNRKISGDDFEELVWHLLIRDTLVGSGISIPSYYLNGTSAGNIDLHFDNYYVIPKPWTIPKFLRNQNVLFRMIDNYPRYDFISLSAFIQTSISDFVSHNQKTKKN